MYRADLPSNCPPENQFKNRKIPLIYRLVYKENFDDKDFLSPLEMQPNRKPRKNANPCRMFAVSIGSLDYVSNLREKSPHFNKCFIAVGSITKDLGVCDNGDNHIDFFPYKSAIIYSKFTLYAETSQEV